MTAALPNIAQLTISAEQRVASKPKYVWPLLAITIAVFALFYLATFSLLPIDSAPEHQLVQAASMKTAKASTLSSKPSITVNQIQPETITPVANNGDESVLDASGHIVARRIATVSSRVTGKLNKLLIEEGQQIGADQLMAQLDDDQAKISLALAEAEISAVNAALAELSVQQRFENKRRQRQVLLAKNNLLSQQQLDDIDLVIARLKTQIQSQQAKLQLAQQRVALAKYNLAQHQIKAPFTGIVISKNAQVGELISAGNSGGSIRTGVGTIVDMDSLEIEVEVAEGYINRVFAGQRAVAKLDAYPDWSISSEVITVIPTADRQKASIKVRIKLLEKDQRILPDMGVKVSFYS